MKQQEIRQKEIEDKKRLEEIRKQEELKKQEALKEAEKAEAIRKAKEEGIELEIIDKKEDVPVEPKPEFKVKSEEKVKEKKEKKEKVIIKKNIFQRLFGKLLFIIIVAIIIIGAVYYCYRQNILPEFAQKQVEDFDKKLQNVIKLDKEVKEGKENLPDNIEDIEEDNIWKVEPTIEADDIKDLTDEVSVIVQDKKEGLINNSTGEIVLEAKYTKIFVGDYYDIDKTEADMQNGIIVKDIEKFYKLDDDYKISTEVKTIYSQQDGAYFYDHHTPAIYYNTAKECKIVKPDSSKSGLILCTDIDIVTTEGVASKDTDLPESFEIDFEKSTITTKGYFDPKTAELKINCDYDEAYEFSNGYAAVKKGTKSGIIDESGKNVIPFDYKETRSVHNNLAFAKLDGKWGILKIK
jgi:hypothetical protein